jgi:hypothetical protein
MKKTCKTCVYYLPDPKLVDRRGERGNCRQFKGAIVVERDCCGYYKSNNQIL